MTRPFHRLTFISIFVTIFIHIFLLINANFRASIFDEIIPSIPDDPSATPTIRAESTSKSCELDVSMLLHGSSFELKVEEARLEDNTLTLQISVTSLLDGWWSSDENRRDEIFLDVNGRTFSVLDMKGIPTQDVGSPSNFAFEEGVTEAGSITFRAPSENEFEFHYLDVDSSGPVTVNLEECRS